jgi:organic radical activating enzyme
VVSRGAPPGETITRSGPAAARPATPVERIEIHVTYHCDDACVFCSEEKRMRWYGPDPERTDFLESLLAKAAARGVRHVNFTGGEPTLHPEFIRLLRTARSLGYTTYIGTNGTMLAREEWAAEAAPLLDEVSLSLHGPDAALHDAMTARAGSFEFLRAAAAHVRRFNPAAQLLANIVVIRDNFHGCADTVRLAATWGCRQALISSVAPEGAVQDDFGRFVARLSDFRAAVPSIARAADESGIALRFFGLPLCALGRDHMALSNDLHWAPRSTVERTFEEAAAPPAGAPRRLKLHTVTEQAPTRNRMKSPRCAACSADPLCGGYFAAYHAVHGDAELQPI